MSTIYIHWPYCISKCHYCDFNSTKCNNDIDYIKWLAGYKNVIKKYKDSFYDGKKITSIYFGGGTPSLLPEKFINDILEIINNLYKLSDDIEITIEANPKTITKAKAINLRNAGINRMSIGIQSIIDDDLKMLGRIHNAEDAKQCVYEMSEIFDNLSIDMIYNRPSQKINAWKNELEKVLQYPINHISLYELIVEQNTKLKKMIDAGILDKPSDSSIFFEETIKIAQENGFEMYEVSNFAKDKKYGKHNVSYWKYEDYYGIGAGAHSRCTVNNHKVAISQISDNDTWLQHALQNQIPIYEEEILTQDDEYKERLIMGLRSKFGINLNKIDDNIQSKYGIQKKLQKLKTNSYIINNGDHVILTIDGIMKLNLIVEYLTKENV